VLAGPVVAVVTLTAALLATHAAGVPLRDPGQVAGRRFALACCLVVVLVGVDIMIRAARRSGRLRPSLGALRDARRERWTLARAAAVGGAVVSFYVTYLAYRNLKSVVPLLRTGEPLDRRLADLDRGLFVGHDPAALLHTVLGTGISAHILSAVYMLFFAFIPLALALALVLSPGLKTGLFFVTALSINWALATASYFLVPALGPIYAAPAVFADLPATEVSRLQDVLIDQRIAFLRDPAGGTAQSIGAFASLHVSIIFTAAVATHLLGLARSLRIGVWILFALTVVATVYFGWHYVLDDLAGLVIAGLALALARILTGIDLRSVRRLPAPAPTPT